MLLWRMENIPEVWLRGPIPGIQPYLQPAAHALQQVEGVSNEEVGAQLLTLQTRMQASLQITSMLYQTSLVNYIK